MDLKEKVKRDNQEAHVVILMRNLNEANSSLGEALDERNKVEADVNDLTKQLKNATVQLDEIAEAALSTTISVENKLSLLNQKEEKIEQIREETETDLYKKTATAEKEVGVFHREKAQLKKDKEMLLEEVVVTKNELESLGKRASDLAKDMKKSMSKKREVEESSFQTEKEHQKIIAEMRREASDLEKTLKQLEDEVSDKKENIDLGQINLDERTAIILKRERNFQILLVRLRSLYQEIKPGIPVNI